MGTLYLHIGTPKTGTTAIQRFLWINADCLKEQSFCYPHFKYRFPHIRKERNAHFLVNRQKCDSLSQEETKQIRQSEMEQFYEGLDHIKELMNEYPNIILSDENIWNGYKKKRNFWKLLTEACSERGITLKVFVYLRRQDLLIESYWLQMVKSHAGWDMSFKEYVDSNKYDHFKLDYYGQLQKISKYVGKENITVRVYEKQQYEAGGNTLIGDFLQTIGVEMNDRFKKPDIVVNTRLSGSYLELKRILNKNEFLRENDELRTSLKALQKETGAADQKYLTYDEQIAFLSKYEQSNMSVAKEYLNREDGILFRDEIKRADDTNVQNFSAEELVLICGRILQMQYEKMEAMKAEPPANPSLLKKIADKTRHPFRK